MPPLVAKTCFRRFGGRQLAEHRDSTTAGLFVPIPRWRFGPVPVCSCPSNLAKTGRALVPWGGPEPVATAETTGKDPEPSQDPTADRGDGADGCQGTVHRPCQHA